MRRTGTPTLALLGDATRPGDGSWRAGRFLAVAAAAGVLLLLATWHNRDTLPAGSAPLGSLPGQGGAAFCASVPFLKRVPKELELPFSPDSPKDARAFAPLILQSDISMAVRGVERNYSMYIFKKADGVSWKVRTTGGAWESALVLNVIDHLYTFAEAHKLPPSEVYFIDVGANLGSFTLAVAAHGFRVLAFEAMYSNAMALSLALCDAPPATQELVALVNKGLGRQPGSCTLYSQAKNNRGNGVVRCGQHAPLPSWIKRARLDIVRLDDVLAGSMAALRGRVGVVKMDIEGSEPLVVEGGRRFLQEVAPSVVVAECAEELIHNAAGYPSGEFLSKVSELGYDVYVNPGDQYWKGNATDTSTWNSTTWQALPQGAVQSYTCRSDETVVFASRRDPSARPRQV